MHRLLSLLPLVLLLVGCRSAGPTVNPFMGSTTVPAQPTGAIGAGNVAPPYYPPNVAPGQPTGMPSASPYGAPAAGQPTWMPQGTGAVGNNPANGQYAAMPNAYQASGNVVDLDAQMKNSAMYDPQVQPASATSNSITISNPISYSNPQESAVRVPTDSSPLVTQRQQLPPVVQFAPVAAPQSMQQLQPQYSPTVYNTQAGYAQTIIPAQRSAAPLTALSSSSGQQMKVAPQGTPASLVYGVTQQEIQPQHQQHIQLQPIPQHQLTTVSSRSDGVPTLASGPTLAAGPTLAVAQTPVTRIMPVVDFADLPPARGVIR
jgi:hypothetical protein